jgi:hypothetical protein
MKVLLLEPKTTGKYVPIGLLKIARREINNGNSVYLHRINEDGYKNLPHFDIAYVTSLYTWEWKWVWEAIDYVRNYVDKVVLGGIYASALPEHARKSRADEVYEGVMWEVEDVYPAYELVPECDYSIVYASRGCVRNCGFCLVRRVEGYLREKESIKHLVNGRHKKVVLQDNNIIAMKNWEKIWRELLLMNKLVDFNGGIDTRILTRNEKIVKQLGRLKLRADEYISLRLALDDMGYKKYMVKSARLLKEYGVTGDRQMYYTLYNFKDTPEDFIERIRTILEEGCVSFPMRYQAIEEPYALKKDSYIGKHWNERMLKMVDDFIWKYGQGGAIPPYLKERFEKANDFYEAFGNATGIKRLSEFA